MARIAFEKFSGGQPIQRSESKPKADVSVGNTPFSKKITEFLGLGGATKTFGDLLARRGIGTDTAKEVTQEFIDKPTGAQVAGAVAQTVATAGGLAVGAPAALAGKVALGGGLGYAYDVGQDLIDKKGAVETLTPGVGTAIGAAAPVVAPVVKAIKGPAEKTLNAVAKPITDSTATNAIKQTTTDLSERVPRFVGRVSDDVKERAVKQLRIKNSPPLVQNALKVDLPDQFIDPVI